MFNLLCFFLFFFFFFSFFLFVLLCLCFFFFFFLICIDLHYLFLFCFSFLLFVLRLIILLLLLPCVSGYLSSSSTSSFAFYSCVCFFRHDLTRSYCTVCSRKMLALNLRTYRAVSACHSKRTLFFGTCIVGSDTIIHMYQG